MAKLNSLVKAAYETAKELVKDKEQLIPIFLLLDRENKIHIIGTPYDGDDEKDMAAAFVRKKAKELDAIAYIHISEAWMKSMKASEYNAADFVRPSQSESRQEVLIVVGEDEDGHSATHVWPIERDDDNKRSLGPEDESFKTAQRVRGRFANLLSE